MFQSKAEKLSDFAGETKHTDRIIEYNTFYINNDFSTHDYEISILLQKLADIKLSLLNANSYADRLNIWHESEIYCCSGVWLGDTSRIVKKNGVCGFVGPRPEPDLFISVNPTTRSEILDFNLRNIASYTEQIGSFEDYRANYLDHLKRHSGSAMFERKLVTDINEAEKDLAAYEAMSWYDVSRNKWYESFTNRHDTLNKNDYEIWGLHERLKSLPILNNNGSIEPPYLLYLLDEPTDVKRAAEGYILHQKIPFLKKLKDEYYDEVIAAVEANTLESTPPSLAVETGVRLQWKGDKTDLAELVWMLAKSGRILNTSTGQPITQKDLTSRVEELLKISLNTMGLMQGRKRSFKAADDGITFSSLLAELVDAYVSGK